MGALPTTGNSLLDGGGGFGVRLGSQTHLPLGLDFAFAHVGCGWRVTSDGQWAMRARPMHLEP
ncbi:MAG TPA: hypothetical protein VMI75_34030 [Polyangiaceae bacterium]|nr:hypothetical protein [Polyangiaceae bacterium]